MSSANLTFPVDAARPPNNPALELKAAETLCTGHPEADGPRGRVLPATTLARSEE